MSESYTPPPSAPYQPAGAPQRSNVLSILSLVGGGLGVLLSFFLGAGFLFGVAGVVLGFIARRREPHARGLWLTGLILGFVAIALSLLVLVGFIVAIIAAAANDPTVYG